MFESIRKHSKIAMLVMFLLIIPSFVLVGIDSTYFSGSSPVVARVDGHQPDPQGGGQAVVGVTGTPRIGCSVDEEHGDAPGIAHVVEAEGPTVVKGKRLRQCHHATLRGPA